MLKSFRTDGRDAAEVPGADARPRGSTPSSVDLDPGLEAGRVHLVGRGREDEVDAGLRRRARGRAPRRAGSAARSVVVAELRRVDEQAHDDGVALGAGGAEERRDARRAARPSSARARSSRARRGASAARISAIVRHVLHAGTSAGEVADRRPAAAVARRARGRASSSSGARRGSTARCRSTVSQSPRAIGPVSSKPFSIVRRDQRVERLGRRAGRLEQRAGRRAERDEVVRGDRGARVVGGAVARRRARTAAGRASRRASSRAPAPRRVSAVTAAQAPSSCSGPRPVRERLQRVEAEAPLVRVERGERRRAADVRDPRARRDRRRDLGDRPVGNAEEDELRRRRPSSADAALGEPGAHRRADAAARADDSDALDHCVAPVPVRDTGHAGV